MSLGIILRIKLKPRNVYDFFFKVNPQFDWTLWSSLRAQLCFTTSYSGLNRAQNFNVMRLQFFTL